MREGILFVIMVNKAQQIITMMFASGALLDNTGGLGIIGLLDDPAFPATVFAVRNEALAGLSRLLSTNSSLATEQVKAAAHYHVLPFSLRKVGPVWLAYATCEDGIQPFQREGSACQRKPNQGARDSSTTSRNS